MIRRSLCPQMAADSGARPDPYVLNSRANALGSLGRWEGAPSGTRTLRYWSICRYANYKSRQ